jgi:Zn-dependent peptidase ImmA (M78 family)/DNA-binding XRE family transcriptional regulator
MKEIISQKIKNARLINAMSQQDLADLVGISKQMISKYEKGESIPSSPSLIKLAKSLKVKVDYFFSSNKIELGTVNFRKKSSFSLKKQNALKELIKLKLESYIEIEEILQIDYSFTNPLKPRFVKKIDEIEKLVLELRNDWEIGLDPIHNIIQLLEDKEIKVVEIDEEENLFDGLATIVNDKFPVIVVNKNFNVERKRFTLLHELGHLLLNLPDCDIKSEENYCNKFASEFLFPKKLVFKEFGLKRDSISLTELIEVQKKYGISIPAIIYRLVDAGIFSEGRLTDFYKKINSNPNLKIQVYKERFETPENSNRFEQLVYRSLSQELVSMSKASSLLNVNINAIIENSLI